MFQSFKNAFGQCRNLNLHSRKIYHKKHVCLTCLLLPPGIKELKTDSKNFLLTEKIKKLVEEFDTYDFNFETRGEVFNILTKTMLSVNRAESFSSMKKIGEKNYSDFVSKRQQGEKPI